MLQSGEIGSSIGRITTLGEESRRDQTHMAEQWQEATHMLPGKGIGSVDKHT